MSAWVVTETHINVLIAAAFAVEPKLSWYWKGNHHELNHLNTDEVGRMLWEENIRAVRHRYEDRHPDMYPTAEEVTGYSFPLFSRRSLKHEPVVVLKAISCYVYQCAEPDDYKETQAYAFCESLRDAVQAQLPGYDEAPWGDYEEVMQ